MLRVVSWVHHPPGPPSNACWWPEAVVGSRSVRYVHRSSTDYGVADQPSLTCAYNSYCPLLLSDSLLYLL